MFGHHTVVADLYTSCSPQGLRTSMNYETQKEAGRTTHIGKNADRFAPDVPSLEFLAILLRTLTSMQKAKRNAASGKAQGNNDRTGMASMAFDWF